jgi:hypothetical protein
VALSVIGSGFSLGGFYVAWIRTDSNPSALADIGNLWAEAFFLSLPGGERLGELWGTSGLAVLTPFFPGLLIGGSAALLSWLLMSLGASWQNSLYFGSALRRLGVSFSPLWAYFPFALIQIQPDSRLHQWQAVLPFALTAFLIHHNFAAIQAACLPDATRRSAPSKGPNPIPHALVWGGALIMFFLWTWLAWMRHDNFLTQGYDLALMSHLMDRLVTGRGLNSSLLISGGNFLGHHFSPILLLIAPFYFFCPHPEALMVVQTGAAAFAAIPLYKFGERVLGSPWAAAAMAWIYLILPGLSEGIFDDFHAIALAPLFLFWLAWEGICAERFRFWIPFVLLLMIQENLFFYAFALGIFVLFYGLWIRAAVGAGSDRWADRRPMPDWMKDPEMPEWLRGCHSSAWRTARRVAFEWMSDLRIRGATIACLSLIWAAVLFNFIQPHLQVQGDRGYGFVNRYQDFVPASTDPEKATFGALGWAVVTNPGKVFSLILDPSRLEVFRKFWRGLLYLPLWNPFSWVLLTPCLENTLSSDGYLHIWGGHYGIGPVMATALASISSLALFARWKRASRYLAPAAWTLLLSAVLWSGRFSMLPFSSYLPSVQFAQMQVPKDSEHFLHVSLPFGKSVAAQSNLLPHITFMDRLYLIPPGVHIATQVPLEPDANEFEKLEPDTGWPSYIVLDTKAPPGAAWYNLWFYSPEKVVEWSEWLVGSRRYHPFLEHGSLKIYERAPEWP